MKQLLGVLRGVNSNTKRFVFSIEEDTLYRIGRDDKSDLCINIENLICETHCVISSSFDPFGNVTNVYLTDISTTGTYLNACLIGLHKTVLLYSGCFISFASEHLSLQYIQHYVDNEQFSAFTMTVQQQKGAGREIKITNKEVGRSNQFVILLAYDKEYPNRQLVCKHVDLSKAKINPWLLKTYEAELKVLKGNKHPNVMSLVALHENQQQKFAFLPLYYGGSLQERLSDSNPSVKQMNERDATFLIKQLFAGLDHLHDRDIIHCDLKVPPINKQSAPYANYALQPSNILLADRYTDRPRLVIADFGHSMHKACKPETWPEDYGTVEYHAPEMVHLSEFSDKVDSWAVGVIFYQLLVGEHPFTGCDKSTLEKRIVTCGIELSSTVFENISRPSRQIIEQLTQRNQHQRSTIKQAMQIKTLFDWFAGDDKVAHDHYLRERELWFGEVEGSSSAPKCAKQKTVQDDYFGISENVDTIRKLRDPSNPNTFLIAPQTDLSLYPSLLNRFDSFRCPHEFL